MSVPGPRELRRRPTGILGDNQVEFVERQSE